MSDARQWPRVKELFHAALERVEPEQSCFLDDACRDDPALRAEIARLLLAHAQSADFIERPAEFGTPMTGRTVGRYEVGRLIGAGGMGEVYAARDVGLQRDVAIKIASGTNDAAHAGLRREAQHASQLNHPHICTIYEVGDMDGRPYIVMEYLEGSRLDHLVPAGGLQVETVVRHGIQIADALAHAHVRGITHRDLKAANVIVTPESRAKVLDFGLAQTFSRQDLKELSESQASVTAESVMAGTLSCMAPELLRGMAADGRSDIWALGVLLYEMCAGKRPFPGATGFELSAAILHEAPPPLPAHIPQSLQSIIQRCLVKSPADRYQQAEEVRSALEAASAPQTGGIRRNHGRAIAAVLLVALSAIAGLTWRMVRPAVTPAAATSARPAIAVMPFVRIGEQNEEDAWMSNGVPSMLLTGLAQTRGLDIVGTERLNDALKRRGGTSFASLDKSAAADVARYAGAGAVVVGSIIRAGPEIRIDAQLEDLSSGRVIVAHSVRGTDLFALVDDLAERIRTGIGDTHEVKRVAEVSTSSLEAYRLYSLGIDAFLNTRMDEAQQRLEAAVAIDPAFAEAYQALSAIMSFRGFAGARREYLAKAAQHANRLSEPRQLQLKAQLAHDVGNWAEAKDAVDELLAKFPNDTQGYLMAGRFYIPRPGFPGNLQKLLRILSAGVTALPDSPDLHNDYGYGLLEAGRYPEAIREFETFVALAPREPNPYDSLGDGYLLAGDAARAVESYSRALTIDPTFHASRNGRAWSLAALGRYDEAIAEKPPVPSVRAFILARAGRYNDAAKAIALGIQESVRNDDIPEQVWMLFAASTLAIERNDYLRALLDIRSARGMLAGMPEEQRRAANRLANLLGGVAQLGAGRTDIARTYLDAERRLGEPAGEVERWWSKALEGEIALADGDFQKASAAFAAGEPTGRMWFALQQRTVTLLANDLTLRDGPARVAQARGDLAGAIQIYRRLLVYDGDQKWVAALQPRYVFEIARLLEQRGETQPARIEYERFLDLWKTADPDLPELAAAKRAVDHLRRRTGNRD